MIREE